MHLGTKYLLLAAGGLCLMAAITSANGASGNAQPLVDQSSLAVSPTDVDVPAGDGRGARFIARKEPVENLFKAIGSEIRKAVRFSNKARQYRISGEFELAQPFEVIERVTSSLGLLWYFDGQVIYVYDSSEAASAMLTVAPEAVDNLVSFLKKSALYDKRFPIKHSVGTRLIYVSGPPKYVEIVQGAASLMHNQVEVTQRGERYVELIKIRHAAVASRNYARRGTQDSVPGLASVLAAALGSGASVKEARTPPPEADAPAPFDSRGGPPVALPVGVREMPALDSSLPVAAAMFAQGQQTPQPSRKVLAPSMAQQEPADESRPMNIVAYPSSNSLLLEGTARQLSTARRLIAQLDVPKEQVEMSLWVIDIRKTNLDLLGAQWSAGGRLGDVEVGFNMRSLGQGATLSRTQAMQFIASVTALSEQNKARIVARPILLAQDNSPAVFDNSTTFLIRVRGERVASLEKITYGTMIDVTPHVVDTRGRIEMELNIEDGNSSNPSRASGLDLPVVASTKISTVARVQHEQSILVGGYTRSQSNEGQEKIPLLGDIPWLGRLFTFRNTNEEQSIRLFLIQPRLLADDNRFERERVHTPREIDDAVDALKQYVESSRG